MITGLGIAFAIIYVIGLFKGRKAFILTLAAAVPFNDSAMIAFGSVGISPFSVGMMLYATIGIFGRRAGEPRSFRASKLPLLLWLVGAFITAFGPGLFSGMHVIATGVGLDIQIAFPSRLGYSLSNFAQVAYLGLAMLLLHFNEKDRAITPRFITVSFVIGTSVAMAAWVLQSSWPHAFFDNFPGNFYATNAARLRGQFSEPSHLGGFAVAAAVYFAMSLFRARSWRGGLLHAGFFALSVVMLVANRSGTAVLGIVAAAAVILLMGLIRMLRPSTKIHPAQFIAGIVAVLAAIIAAPTVTKFVTSVIDDKQDGISLANRNLSNSMAWDVFTATNGFGVGLGGNRASSLFLMLLSQIGIVGVLLFLFILFRCIRNSIGVSERIPMLLALIAYMAASFASLADFIFPTMWVLIAACFIKPDRELQTQEPPDTSGIVGEPRERLIKSAAL